VATIIEVGTYMGRSAVHMAKLIPENGKLYAVDTFSG
jgi:predicted O-methyltransferase YrrM